MATLTLISKSDELARIWGYECGCGLAYRVASVDGSLRFRAAAGARRRGVRWVDAGDACVRCARPLRTAEDRRAVGARPVVAQVRASGASPPAVVLGPVGRLSLRCAGCGYGAIASSKPPHCPMCLGSDWDFADWRPFSSR